MFQWTAKEKAARPMGVGEGRRNNRGPHELTVMLVAKGPGRDATGMGNPPHFVQCHQGGIKVVSLTVLGGAP